MEANTIPVRIRAEPIHPKRDSFSFKRKKDAIAVKIGSVQKASDTNVAETLSSAIFCRL